MTGALTAGDVIGAPLPTPLKDRPWNCPWCDMREKKR